MRRATGKRAGPALRRRAPLAIVALLLLLAVHGASGQEALDPSAPPEATEPVAAPEAQRARPAGAPARGVLLVPDGLLRRWDPLTLFFPRPTGPADGGPEDTPERFVRLAPAHPGAWSWLDATTLQFAPADPWPPLERFTVSAAGETFRLTSLLEAPRASHPAAGAVGLPPVEEISLTFADPVPAEALARALVIEIRPLPGFGDAPSRFLTRQDFEIKARERAARAEPSTYVVALRRPIPTGHRIFVRVRTRLDDPPERAVAEIAFSTAEPFRALRFGCRREQLPVVPGGARYSAEQALVCEDAGPALVVDFSALPAALGVVEAKNLVRVSPAVDGLEARLSGRRLELTGEFARETAYRVTLVPTPIEDQEGRPLDLAAVNELVLAFPRAPSYLRAVAGEGVVERHGPRMLPLVGRGDERLDLRIQRIDPLDRGFFPFPERPVDVDESARPPGPGEVPAPWSRPDVGPDATELARRIASLGSPPVSRLVDLPLRRDGGSAAFGLDLAADLDRIAGRGEPGTYLVGLRRLAGPPLRQWTRLQVSDLALTTLEEPQRTLFAVTSLATARPVPGAEVVVEGAYHPRRGAAEARELFRGRTDARGLVAWPAPGPPEEGRLDVTRLIVAAGEDRLVLDPDRAPDLFADGRFEPSSERWLQWTQWGTAGRGAGAEDVAHLFAERPVHRPEEPVLLKGFLRRRDRGRLAPITEPVILVIEGPGDFEWRYERTPSASGSIDFRFEEKDLPTGQYRARVERAGGGAALSGAASFRKEAYRLPRFEVRLDGPERVPLDRPFEVALSATYYAGGRLSGRPVEWRVTQFPFDWSPATRPGFRFSSDARFARDRRLAASPALERADTTDGDGGSRLTLDPTAEATAQARTYVVEATVIDADEQTVTATRQVVAVPPLAVGLEVPRFVERAGALSPRVLVLGPDGGTLAGERVTVRLRQRQWHSYLRASDFTDGVARYVTEVVEHDLGARTVISAAEPLAVPFELPEAGVYVVEAEVHDRLGRAQRVALDLFAGGEGAVTWEKPATRVFQVTPDQARYAPGDRARLVLESPFQSGEALAAVEAPEGLRYSWLPVRQGRAVFELPIEGSWSPRLPVHFLLLRGRLEGSGPAPGNATDLGRPATFGATVWLEVEPVAHRLEVRLAHPTRARPGETIEIGVELADPRGAPLAGEVTLWLVDQAVMSLGREARLDPVPSFLAQVRSFFAARDTRSLVFGFLPFAELPGGDEGEEARSLFDRQTVRKNLQPVPYWAPTVVVPPEGRTSVRVELPDDLTNFLVRAKAISGAERFGYAAGRIEVRQPIVLQPALPRFVRPGDRFEAVAVGRVVEGEGGAAAAQIEVEGLSLEGPARQQVALLAGEASRLGFALAVPTPGYDAEGRSARSEVVVRLGLERMADRAGDAVETRLPIRPDRDRVRVTLARTLEPGVTVALPEPEEPARPGTLRRRALIAARPGLVELAAGLDYLIAYPHGCTEQRLAAVRGQIALRRLRDLLGLEEGAALLDRGVADLLGWLPLVQDDGGLFAFWPGGRGSVALTAWTAELLVEARDAGYRVDPDLEGRALAALERALRSDSQELLSGEAWGERTWALAALARAGRFDVAYGNELARRAELLDLEHAAGVLVAFERAGRASAPALQPVEEALWSGFLVRLHQGREIFGGLRAERAEKSPSLLPSETRTLAALVRALAPRADGERERQRLELLTRALVDLGRGDGWGTTNANAAALTALAQLLDPAGGAAGAAGSSGAWEIAGAGAARGRVAPEAPTARWSTAAIGAATLRLEPGASGAVEVRAELDYLPAAPGSQAEARRAGFVVTRELLVYRGPSGSPPERMALDRPGAAVALALGEVVEERVRLVNPEERHYVALVVPLAAGIEPLDPALETAPPEARTEGRLTLEPAYRAFFDDRVAFYYDTLPAGSYEFAFRARAQIPGDFQLPGARAETMYDGAVNGSSPGSRLTIERRP